MPSTFVGFGFGAIQAGLFLPSAAKGGFERLVVAYRRQEVINAVRAAQGRVSLNIAHRDHIEQVTIGPVELYNVGLEQDGAQIIEAIGEASELATALGSVDDYRSPEPGSVHRLLAAGLARRTNTTSAVIYAAENHTQAAQLLKQAIAEELPTSNTTPFQTVNTVIGKMSVTVRGSAELASRNLAPVAPGLDRAFLAEAFSHILVEKPKDVALTLSFEEKEDLTPFEEAKLYGHNALHALAAYLGGAMGLETVRDIEKMPWLYAFLKQTSLKESGEPLIRKYRGVDPLFTREGFEAFTDNLLERMTNPFLNDTTQRVGRDAPRKLGWNDRLVGTMRLALNQGVHPSGLTLGVAAALDQLDKLAEAEAFLRSLWQVGEDLSANEVRPVLELVLQGCSRFKVWRSEGFPPLESASD